MCGAPTGREKGGDKWGGEEDEDEERAARASALPEDELPTIRRGRGSGGGAAAPRPTKAESEDVEACASTVLLLATNPLHGLPALARQDAPTEPFRDLAVATRELGHPIHARGIDPRVLPPAAGVPHSPTTPCPESSPNSEQGIDINGKAPTQGRLLPPSKRGERPTQPPHPQHTIRQRGWGIVAPSLGQHASDLSPSSVVPTEPTWIGPPDPRGANAKRRPPPLRHALADSTMAKPHSPAPGLAAHTVARGASMPSHLAAQTSKPQRDQQRCRPISQNRAPLGAQFRRTSRSEARGGERFAAAAPTEDGAQDAEHRRRRVARAFEAEAAQMDTHSIDSSKANV